MASDLGPNLSFGGGGGVDLQWRTATGRPSVALGVEYVSGAAFPAGSGAQILLRSVLGDVEPCLELVHTAKERFALDGCARLDAGVRLATGEDVVGGHTVVRPWVALGPSARIRVLLGGGWFVDASGGVFFPFIRDQLGLVGTAAAADVGAVGGRGSLGVGLHFW
jgi:hypothetical protein